MGLVGLMGLMGLVGSCSKGDDAALQMEGTSFEVVSYAPYFDENELKPRANEARANEAYEAYGANEAYGFTRAWSVPAGYVAYDGGDQKIGVCFTQNDHNPVTDKTTGQLFKSSGKWRGNMELTAGDYYLYGYIPHLTVMKCGITDREGNHAKYDEGATLTLRDVPSVMPTDLCVVIGAKHGTDKETVASPLRRGDFAYTAEAISNGSGGTGNYVFLLFDHLYAALRINLKVHGDYNDLRTIKLKSLKLKTQVGETASYDKTNITITLKANDGTASPIENITYTPAGVVYDDGIEFWPSGSVSDAERTLTTVAKPFTGHFMPDGITTMVLTSTYDVYDKKGNLIREGCKATNTMVLNDLLTGQIYTRRGCRYDITMTIRPTYLYVMSDEDLKNPGMEVIINE
jgi:hypothetical protein